MRPSDCWNFLPYCFFKILRETKNNKKTTNARKPQKLSFRKRLPRNLEFRNWTLFFRCRKSKKKKIFGSLFSWGFCTAKTSARWFYNAYLEYASSVVTMVIMFLFQFLNKLRSSYNTSFYNLPLQFSTCFLSLLGAYF